MNLLKMKYIPILFSTPMVQAILEGRKSMTRRSIKIKDILDYPDRFLYVGNSNTKEVPRLAKKYDDRIYHEFGLKNNNGPSWVDTCPYGQPGDVMWVREASANLNKDFGEVDPYWVYKADLEHPDQHGPVTWKPSIHMPKSACRIFLEVTDVRVERLQDITGYDVLREGVGRPLPFARSMTQASIDYKQLEPGLKEEFHTLWDKINGEKYPWDNNNWVWVVSFNRIDKLANF